MKCKKYLVILISAVILTGCKSETKNKKNDSVDIEKKSSELNLVFVNLEDNSTCELFFEGNNVIIKDSNKEIKGTISNAVISTETCRDCFRINHGDDGEGWVLEKYDNYGNFENVYYFSEKNPMGSFEKLTSLIENGTEEKQIVNSNSSFQSLGEIRALVLTASLRTMKKRLGEPDESMGADDYLLKYHNWKPFSVYSSNRTLYSLVFVYENLLEKPIVVIFNNQSGEVFDVMYKDDIKSFEDLAVNFRYH